MIDRFDRVLVPVASVEDARVTARSLNHHDGGAGDRVFVVVYVVEKAGGAPDKASVEQRRDVATEAFDVFRAELGPEVAVETDVLYGMDVVETIFEAARDRDVAAIAFTPREGGRLVRLLTGDLALSLITGADRPVIAFPRTSPESGGQDDTDDEEDAADE